MTPGDTTSLDTATIRCMAISSQGLADPVEGELHDLVEGTGFLRTLGGVDAYLALKARRPGLTRSEIDRAVLDRELQILPSVRACIYLVPEQLASLSLRLSELLSRRRNEREAEKAGIRPGELEDLGQSVLETLRRIGPVTTPELRKAMPEGSIRSLGEAGKKVGISSTLPPSLRLLEWAGEVERQVRDGRIDTERYLWAEANRSPAHDNLSSIDLVDLAPRLAEIFLRAAGAGTLEDFVAWSGLGKRVARTALSMAPAMEVEVGGLEEPYWVLSERLEAASGSREQKRRVALLPFADNLLALHGGLAAWVEEQYHELEVPTWGRGRPTQLGQARHASFRSVLVGDRVVGFWEFDPDRGDIEIGCFAPISTEDRERLEAEAITTSDFLRDQLGHARSFSLDTEKALAKRCASIRDLAAG